jgi:hypothetical protein
MGNCPKIRNGQEFVPYSNAHDIKCAMLPIKGLHFLVNISDCEFSHYKRSVL